MKNLNIRLPRDERSLANRFLASQIGYVDSGTRRQPRNLPNNRIDFHSLEVDFTRLS